MTLRSLIFFLLTLFLGASYIISGYLKLFPTEYLENDILRSGLGTEWTVPFQSRILIGLEFVTGAFLIFNLYLKRTLKFSLWLLICYTLYLFYIIIRFGNEGNCGCYGQQLAMTPLQGIFKNILIGAFSYFLLRTVKDQKLIPKPGKFLALFFIVAFMSLPFVLYQIDLPEKILINGQEAVQADLDILYNTINAVPPPFEIRKGKALVAFMSLSCQHCRMAANKLELIKQQHPELPIYFVLNGKMDLMEDFLKVTEVNATPYTLFNSGDALVKITGPIFPVILLLEDSYEIARLDYMELSADNILIWYNGH